MVRVMKNYVNISNALLFQSVKSTHYLNYQKGRGSIVQFQKISILPPQKGMEFLEGRGFCGTHKSKEMCEPLIALTAAWLAQLVECQSAVREVEGSRSRPDKHSGS